MFAHAKIFAAFAAMYAATASALPTEGKTTVAKRQTYSGVATYYSQDGNVGSCGQYHSDSDNIGALGTYWMDQGGYCGDSVTITNSGNGNSVTITVADTCDSCDETHINLATGPFETLTGGSLDAAEINIEWHFD